MSLELRPAGRPRPGAAPVSEHSEFEPISNADPPVLSLVGPESG